MKPQREVAGIARHDVAGLTLVEMLAALVLSAIVITLASRIFLSGNHQYLQRVLESDRLSEYLKLKVTIQHALTEEVSKCASGKLFLRMEGAKVAEQPIDSLIKPRFPDIETLDFRCFETGSDSTTLVEWQGWFQPRLIEYRVHLKKGKQNEDLVGSWIK